MLTVTLRSDDASASALVVDDGDLDETYAAAARFAIGDLTDDAISIALAAMVDEGTFDRVTVWDDDVAADFHLATFEELPDPMFDPEDGIVAFAPDQARDWHGRWTVDGGSPDGAAAAQAHTEAEIVVADGRVTVPRAALLPLLHDLGQRPDPSDLTKINVAGTHLFGSVADNQLRRIDMPQVPSDKVDDFRDYLNARGVTTRLRSADPLTLRATQNELDARKVGQMVTAMQRGMMLSDTHPLWASSDGRILDGHHRWAAEAAMAIAGQGRRMTIMRVGVPMTTLIAMAREFNSLEGIHSKSVNADDNKKWGLTAAGPVDEPRDADGKWTDGGASSAKPRSVWRGTGTYRVGPDDAAAITDALNRGDLQAAGRAALDSAGGVGTYWAEQRDQVEHYAGGGNLWHVPENLRATYGGEWVFQGKQHSISLLVNADAQVGPQVDHNRWEPGTKFDVKSVTISVNDDDPLVIEFDKPVVVPITDERKKGSGFALVASAD